MAYETFALKYRPQTFDEIIGQDHVATTLKHAITEGRVAHGYLFAGPRGTGKTSTARVLAKALNCENGPTAEPCCECEMCRAIASGSALDLIEIDAASNRGIDDIRELRSKVGYAPTQARSKFYILDEAHMLTNEAANALLKTLEEPPDHVYFVLATTEPHNILPTIRSRCQSFEFRPIPQAKIVGALRAIADNEDVEAEDGALGAIARAAGGAMRDAESIFDQVIAYGRGEVTLEVVNSILGVTDADLLASVGDAVAANDIEGVFEAVDEVVASGKDIGQLLEDLSLYFRDILRLSLGANPPEWMRTAAAETERMQQQANMMGSRRVGEVIEELGEASSRIRDTSQKPLLLEVTLAHLASASDEAVAGAPAARESSTDESGAREPEEEPEAEPEEPEPSEVEEPAEPEAEAVEERQEPDEPGPGTQEEPEPSEAQAADPQAETVEEPQAPEAPEPEAEEEPAEEAAAEEAPVEEPGAEEAPEEQPEPAPLPDGPLSLDDVRAHWGRVAEALHDSGQISIAALIERARPDEVEEDTITLIFPAEAAFEHERVSSSYMGEIASAVESVYERAVTVVCDLEGGAADIEAASDGAPQSAQQQEMVDALKLNFEGSEEDE